MTGVRDARDTVMAGFTKVRDVGTYAPLSMSRYATASKRAGRPGRE